jgi:hypothetical protein
MKFPSAALLVVLTAASAAAFVPLASQRNSVRPSSLRRSMVSEEVDVRIPYDAAARLAYDEWLTKYEKGSFDEARYAVFKANYEAIAVANVVAKRIAREEGATDAPSLMTLNEYGDCTEEEYKAAMSQPPTSTTAVLSTAMEAAQSQSEASSALKDAADALAEEEEVRVLRIICCLLFALLVCREESDEGDEVLRVVSVD